MQSGFFVRTRQKVCVRSSSYFLPLLGFFAAGRLAAFFLAAGFAFGAAFLAIGALAFAEAFDLGAAFFAAGFFAADLAFGAAFFAAGALAFEAAFLAAGFFAADFFTADPLPLAVAFLAAGFFAAADFAAGFFVDDFELVFVTAIGILQKVFKVGCCRNYRGNFNTNVKRNVKKNFQREKIYFACERFF